MTAADLPHPIQAGDRIAGRWVVRDALGAGGHAMVYRAQHDELGHSVAIKVLHLDRTSAHAEEMLGRFRREARIAARVQHRHVVRVFDFGELPDGSPYFVMELIEGEDLQARIDREGALPLAAGVDVGLQILAALTSLSEHQVVHRDVKPGNIMLQARESGGYLAKLVDLGIASVLDAPIDAKVTIEGTVLGTPEYMAPEQIRGQSADGRADVYSLGVVLHEALTGTLPFLGEGPCATLAMALTQPAPTLRSKRPECPEIIDAIVAKALAKEPADRWQSPFAMGMALSEAAQQLGMPKGAAAWAGTSRPTATRAVGTGEAIPNAKQAEARKKNAAKAVEVARASIPPPPKQPEPRADHAQWPAQAPARAKARTPDREAPRPRAVNGASARGADPRSPLAAEVKRRADVQREELRRLEAAHPDARSVSAPARAREFVRSAPMPKAPPPSFVQRTYAGPAARPAPPGWVPPPAIDHDASTLILRKKQNADAARAAARKVEDRSAQIPIDQIPVDQTDERGVVVASAVRVLMVLVTLWTATAVGVELTYASGSGTSYSALDVRSVGPHPLD